MSWQRGRTVAYKSVASRGTARIFVRRLCDTLDEEFEPSRLGEIPNLSRIHKCLQRPSLRMPVVTFRIIVSRFSPGFHCKTPATCKLWIRPRLFIVFRFNQFNHKQFPPQRACEFDSLLHWIFCKCENCNFSKSETMSIRNIKDKKREIINGNFFYREKARSID